MRKLENMSFCPNTEKAQPHSAHGLLIFAASKTKFEPSGCDLVNPKGLILISFNGTYHVEGLLFYICPKTQLFSLKANFNSEGFFMVCFLCSIQSPNTIQHHDIHLQSPVFFKNNIVAQWTTVQRSLLTFFLNFFCSAPWLANKICTNKTR